MSKDFSFQAGKHALMFAHMHRFGLPIPGGFVISSSAFALFCEHNDVLEKLLEHLPKGSIHTQADIQTASRHVQKTIRHGEFPQSLIDILHPAYLRLAQQRVMLFASDQPNEDGPLSVVDHHIHGVQGDANFFSAVKEMWASFYQPKYMLERQRADKMHTTLPFAITVCVQPIYTTTLHLYTQDPTASTKNTVLIKAVFGEGAIENELQGADYYWIQRGTGELYKEVIDKQRERHTFIDEKLTAKKMPASLVSKRKLSKAELCTLARLAQDIQQHFFFPQQAVVGFDGTSFTIISMRPLTIQQHAQPSLPAVDIHEKKQPNHPINLGLSIDLSPSGHIPSLPTVHGFVQFSTGSLHTSLVHRQTHTDPRVFAKTIIRSLTFLSKNIDIRTGYLATYTPESQDVLTQQATLLALQTLGAVFPNKPLAIAASVKNASAYKNVHTLFHSLSLYRSAHILHGLFLDTPAIIHEVVPILACGLDFLLIDLDAIEIALHGGLVSEKSLAQTRAMDHFLKQSFTLAKEHGLLLFLQSTRLPDGSVIELLHTQKTVEWITTPALYTHIESKLA